MTFLYTCTWILITIIRIIGSQSTENCARLQWQQIFTCCVCKQIGKGTAMICFQWDVSLQGMQYLCLFARFTTAPRQVISLEPLCTDVLCLSWMPFSTLSSSDDTRVAGVQLWIYLLGTVAIIGAVVGGLRHQTSHFEPWTKYDCNSKGQEVAMFGEVKPLFLLSSQCLVLGKCMHLVLWETDLLVINSLIVWDILMFETKDWYWVSQIFDVWGQRIVLVCIIAVIRRWEEEVVGVEEEGEEGGREKEREGEREYPL